MHRHNAPHQPWMPIAFLGCLAFIVTIAAAGGGLSSGAGTTRSCRGSERSGGFDAIIVPGGGQRDDGTEPPHMRARLNAAHRSWCAAALPKPFIICLSAGTPHKPNPRDARGFDTHESTSSARYLIQLGVPPEIVLEEALSLDTIGNAVYLRLLHTEVLGLRRLLVVNNGWHMPRTRAIFDAVFALPFDGDSGRAACEYVLEYEEVADELTPDALGARHEREAQSLAQWQRTAPRFRSLRELHRWMHFEHGAYAVSRLTKQPEKLDEAALKSY